MMTLHFSLVIVSLIVCFLMIMTQFATCYSQLSSCSRVNNSCMIVSLNREFRHENNIDFGMLNGKNASRMQLQGKLINCFATLNFEFTDNILPAIYSKTNIWIVVSV